VLSLTFDGPPELTLSLTASKPQKGISLIKPVTR